MKRLAKKLSIRKDNTESLPTTTDPTSSPPTDTSATTADQDLNMTSSLPETFKAACIVEQGKPLEIKQIPMPEVVDGEILIKVHACGVCHSDSAVLEGHMGPVQVERLGHEYVGTVVAVPASEKKWKVGDRVGGAWHGGHDGSCRSCSRGHYQMCVNKTINGVFRNGGYGEYATLRTEAAVRIPKEMEPAKVAPLLCAGVTVFNGMRRQGITAGEVVAIQGLGGLGHLAVQFASKMGYRTVALSRGNDKKDFALKLGASDYINTSEISAGEGLQKLGGAALIVVTAPNAKAISELIPGLAPLGKLLLHAVAGPIPVDSSAMVLNALSVVGWPSGHALDSEEAIAFAQRQGVECMVETFPLDDANEAMKHMISGKVRFRSVITMD